MKLPIFDYWMYHVLTELLKKEIIKEGKNYTEAGRAMFLNNRWDKYGQLNLCKERLRYIHEEHDKQIKKEMGIEISGEGD